MKIQTEKDTQPRISWFLVHSSKNIMNYISHHAVR